MQTRNSPCSDINNRKALERCKLGEFCLLSYCSCPKFVPKNLFSRIQVCAFAVPRHSNIRINSPWLVLSKHQFNTHMWVGLSKFDYD